MVSLAIEYDNTDGISGNYENGDNSSASHVFRPWLTQLNINKNDGSSSQSYNEPDGTLEVMHNSDNNYTVDFDMTFKDSLNVVGDLTCDFIEQQVN